MSVSSRTVQELSRRELNELKAYLLFNDTEDFYEHIDEITDEAVIARFSGKFFRTKDFACNRQVRVPNINFAN